MARRDGTIWNDTLTSTSDADTIVAEPARSDFACHVTTANV